MDNDENILIGRELWNKIGQEDSKYDEMLDILYEAGEIYIPKMKKNILGYKNKHSKLKRDRQKKIKSRQATKEHVLRSHILASPLVFVSNWY